jgi:hypothetical protein
MNATEMTRVAFLKDRGLDPKLAASYGLYTGRSIGGGKVVPDRDGDVIVFRYLERCRRRREVQGSGQAVL